MTKHEELVSRLKTAHAQVASIKVRKSDIVAADTAKHNISCALALIQEMIGTTVTARFTPYTRMDEATAAAKPADFIVAFRSAINGDLVYAITPEPHAMTFYNGFVVMRQPTERVR